MFYDRIEKLHIEPSSYCNAKCPLCSRFDQEEYPKLSPNLKLKHLDLNLIIDVIKENPEIQSVLSNGNFGDPIMNPQMFMFSEFLFKNNKYHEIHTNGGLQNTDFWYNMGKLFPKNRLPVVFSIDGLEDTNHLYRIGVEWNKVIENTQAFIKGGGTALWKFVIFEHNEHQTEEAEKLSKDLGFDKFKKVQSYRKNYQKNKNYSYLTNETKQTVEQTDNTSIQCVVQKEKSVFISYEGLVFPCCWSGSKFTKYENKEFKKSFEKKFYEYTNNDLKIHKLKDIIYSDFFTNIQTSWKLPTSFDFCERKCRKNFRNIFN